MMPVKEPHREIEDTIWSESRMQCTFREYEPGDIDDVRDLLEQLGYVWNIEELADTIRAIGNHGDMIYVAEHDGKVVGSLCAIIEARLAEGIRAEIVSLVVADGCRGLGIGRSLVELAEKWAGQRVDKINIRANVVRLTAHKFYEGLGYSEMKEQKVFSKKLDW